MIPGKGQGRGRDGTEPVPADGRRLEFLRLSLRNGQTTVSPQPSTARSETASRIRSRSSLIPGNACRKPSASRMAPRST